jgi:uncharacterized membrane protein
MKSHTRKPPRKKQLLVVRKLRVLFSHHGFFRERTSNFFALAVMFLAGMIVANIRLHVPKSIEGKTFEEHLLNIAFIFLSLAIIIVTGCMVKRMFFDYRKQKKLMHRNINDIGKIKI